MALAPSALTRAVGLDSPSATEDAAARRVLAGQTLDDEAGRAT
jgi:hypothetical protein